MLDQAIVIFKLKHFNILIYVTDKTRESNPEPSCIRHCARMRNSPQPRPLPKEYGKKINTEFATVCMYNVSRITRYILRWNNSCNYKLVDGVINITVHITIIIKHHSVVAIKKFLCECYSFFDARRTCKITIKKMYTSAITLFRPRCIEVYVCATYRSFLVTYGC